MPARIASAACSTGPRCWADPCKTTIPLTPTATSSTPDMPLATGDFGPVGTPGVVRLAPDHNHAEADEQHRPQIGVGPPELEFLREHHGGHDQGEQREQLALVGLADHAAAFAVGVRGGRGGGPRARCGADSTG